MLLVSTRGTNVWMVSGRRAPTRTARGRRPLDPPTPYPRCPSRRRAAQGAGHVIPGAEGEQRGRGRRHQGGVERDDPFAVLAALEQAVHDRAMVRIGWTMTDSRSRELGRVELNSTDRATHSLTSTICERAA